MTASKKFNKDFFNSWSPEMAYVLGFFFADGYLQINPNGYKYFSFCSTDKYIIEKIRSLMGSNHKIGIKYKIHKSHKDCYVIQIKSDKVYNQLENYGAVKRKSLIMKFPSVPGHCLGDFVRGYFDGDGCVYFGSHFAKDRNKYRYVFQVRFTSGSKRFLMSLWRSLQSKKICNGGFVYKKPGGYDLVFSHNDGVAIFNLMYYNMLPGTCLRRKYRLFQSAFKNMNIGRVV